MNARTANLERTGTTVEWAHDVLELTWDQVGGLVGASGRTVQRWRDREVVPAPASRARIDDVDRLRFWLEEVFGDDREAGREWLNQRLLDLRGRTPREAVLAGELDRIVEFLATFHAGASI